MITMPYLEEVIGTGDKGSRILAEITSKSRKNSEYFDVIDSPLGSIPVLRIPEKYFVIVHSATGESDEYDPEKHAYSLVQELEFMSRQFDATPVAITNIIDSRKGEPELLEIIARSLCRAADDYGVVIMNGENAILGDRVRAKANISGTMLSIVKKSSLPSTVKGIEVKVPGTVVQKEGVYEFAIFDPKGEPIFMNCDGVGTKAEFYERLGDEENAMNDLFAMNLDDAAKFGADVKVISGTAEIIGATSFGNMKSRMKNLCNQLGILGTLENIKYLLTNPRIKSYKEYHDAFNLTGSTISTLNEAILKSLRPSAGEYIVAIRGKPNPRSNGISSKRDAMKKLEKKWREEHFVQEWHLVPFAVNFAEYLGSPSTILYPVFQELIDTGLASGVYHMSGGAYNGKLARPIARLGLHAMLDNIFVPDPVEEELRNVLGMSLKDAYAQWPMGNDGFVATKDPRAAIHIVNKYGLEAQVAGRLNTAAGAKKGATIHVNKQMIYYDGK